MKIVARWAKDRSEMRRILGRIPAWELLIACLLLGASACSREWKNLPLVDDTIDLSGTWKIRFDPELQGETLRWMEAAAWERGEALDIPVPAAWETLPEGAGYDGAAWYMKRFSIDAPAKGRARLHFGAVNYLSVVYLDGREIARHEGGYGAFEIDLPREEPGHEYLLVVRVIDPGSEPVDGITLEEIPHSKESWYYNFGGIVGDVEATIHGPLHVHDVFAALTQPGNANSEGSNRVSFSLRNMNPAEEDALVRLSITDGESGRTIFQEEDAVPCPPGITTFTWSVKPDDPFEAWSPSTPRLYEVEVRVEGAGFTHRKSVLTGARLFELGEQGFRLNGKPLFVRAVLYQPYYPGTLARPPDAEWVRREVALMKEAGFNMVRAHVRPAPEAFLAECDRQGLLVMAEPAIGWIKKETPQMPERVKAEVESLVRAGRNHPSIVWWGMLNELSGCVHPLRRDLMRHARSLDPTRMITDDSAGWTGSSSYMNPFDSSAQEYGDYHIYLNFPLDRTSRKFLKELGSERKGPVFVSEFGFGGMTDLSSALDHFRDRAWLEDAGEYISIFQEAEEALKSSPLRAMFSSWEEMAELACRVQCEAARTLVGAFLENPRVAGYCYTQFQDVSWELSAGMVDITGNPKPVFETLKELNAQPRGRPSRERITPRLAADPEPEHPEGAVCCIKLDPRAQTLLKDWHTFDIEVHADIDMPTLVVSGGALTLSKPENVDRLARLIRYVRDGGVTLFLRPPRLDNALSQSLLSSGHEGIVADLPITIHYRRTPAGFLGKFHYVDPQFGLFEGFEPAVDHLGRGLGDLMPVAAHYHLNNVNVIVPVGCYDCFGQFVGGDLLAVPYGRGFFVFSHLRLLENLETTPFASTLIRRIADFSLGLSRPMIEEDASFRPPSRESAERFSLAMENVRRLFSLFERLATNMPGGKRKKRNFSEDCLFYDEKRLKGIRYLQACRFERAAEHMEELWDGLPVEWRRYILREEQFIQQYNACFRKGKSGQALGPAREEHRRALGAFSRNEPAEALKHLEDATAALP
jgi:hypothetical protein